MTTQLILTALLAALAGAVLAWGLLRRKMDAARAEGRRAGEHAMQEEVRTAERALAQAETQAANLREVLADQRKAVVQQQHRIEQLTQARATLAAENRNLEARLAEQKTQFEKLEERFRSEFENLAGKILEEKSKKFTEENKTQLGRLLDPLKEKLERFEKEVRQNREKSVEARSTLLERIKHLTDLNQQISQDAADLTRALEGQSKTQGDWGEVILERILTEAGLRKNREFFAQETVENTDGQSARPDVVVMLPDDRCLVIDAKVSITAYRRCVSAEDDAAHAKALREHLRSMRRHVTGLAAKNYHDLHGVHSPDFILMFVPVEPAFALALQEDDNLYNEAFKQNVVIVSPTTLLATMATVENLWKHEYRSRNAQEIARRGGLLYDKFVLFAEALEDVGANLDRAQNSYRAARNRLVQGRGNLTRQVEMLRDLGADAGKEMPDAIAGASRAALDD